MRFLFPAFIFSVIYFSAQAQSAADIENLESVYKTCIRETPDTSGCGKTYLRQMDSILNMVYETVRSQLSANDKIALMKDQKNWFTKKSDFFKKQDENFSFHIQDGSWYPGMIWLVYQNKAEFLRKRALSLIKRIRE